MIKDFCSIGSTWNQKGWLKWAIPGLLGLLLLTLLTRCSPIENDLGQKTQTLLNDQGMGWATTSLDGRDVTITGEAPNVEARNTAVELTKGVYGVRTVHEDMTLKKWFSSQFKLKQAGDEIILSGSLPDQGSIDTAVSKAQSLYGEANVKNELKVSDSASAPAWLAGTTGLMATLFSTRNLDLNASDDKIEISGEVETEAEKAQIVSQAKAEYGDKFSESIKVVKTRPTAEELAAIAAAKLAEEQRIAEEARLAAEAEAARLAEEARLAAEAEAARQAEEARLAAEAEAARQAEEARLAAEAEAARLAEEKRLAAEADEEARLAEEKRLAAIAAAKAKAQAEQMALQNCQRDFEQVLNQNPTLFDDGSSAVRGESYQVMGILAQKINYCSAILHTKNKYVDVSVNAGKGEAAIDDTMSQQRIHSAISYLEVISGAHRGLLRPSSNKTADKNSGHSQLNFNISE